MNHDQAKALFSGYHDGDLDEAALKELEVHLSTCSDCQIEWERFSAAVSEISGLLQMSPSVDVSSAVQQKIRRRSRGKFFGKQKSNHTQFALVSFILILLFMMAYLMLTAVNEIIIIDEPDMGDTDFEDKAPILTPSQE